MRCSALFLAATLAVGVALHVPAQSADPIIIGAATATSGWMSAYDEGPINAARFAISHNEEPTAAPAAIRARKARRPS